LTATNSNGIPASGIVEVQTLYAQRSDRKLAMLTDNASIILNFSVEYGTFGFTGAPV